MTLLKIESEEKFKEHLEVFSKPTSTQDEVAKSGHLLSMMYGEKSNIDLGVLRYRTFCKKINSSKTAVLPGVLPPTSDAAKWHS